ncbi:ADP-ribosylglycohydrolase family protein [Candidatus Uhrbacteria bacterium]|nr:ADP-ribosylglycohydrolase family protein [Candidatus Uhrbacteria bacterium]
MHAIVAERFRDRFRGCMVGLAVGDALGMPVETMTPDEILAATDGKGVTGFLAPLQKRFHSTALLAPGQWTDDTQLSLAIARSLIRKRGFDLADIAAEHILEFHGVRRGWGGSTTRGIEELALGRRKPGDPILDPKAHGLGNGVAMKVAPLALFDVLACDEGRDCELHDQHAVAWFRGTVHKLASLTHRDPCAKNGAMAIAAAVIHGVGIAGNEPAKFREPHQELLTSAAAEAHWPCPTHGHALYDACHLATQGSELYIRHGILKRTQCDVRESVPFVLAICREHLTSFRDGVLAAVNAGGDTDSNGAMVGAILGASHGLSAIPEEWVRGLEAHGEIIALADQLFELASTRTS